MPTALIAGGGLAGIAAACALAEAGWKVTLLEKRRRMGGMVTSFPDPETGEDLDNGEHIAIDACTELFDLMAKLGVQDRVRRQKSLHVPFVGTDGTVAELTESPLSFVTFRFLSLGDRWRVARALPRIGKLTDAQIAPLDHISAEEWLVQDLGQTPASIAAFWDYFLRPALNEPAPRASAALAARLLRDAMGLGPERARFALFTAPLGSVFGDAAAAYVSLRGGEVRPGATLKKVLTGKGAISGFSMSDGATLTADAYVLALGHGDMAEVFPESAPPLEYSPILNAHLFYDRPVTDLEFGALVGSDIQWFFNRTKIAKKPGPGQHLSFSISAAREWAHRPSPEIAAACDTEVKRRFDSPATLKRFVVSREHHATFSARPGTAPMRPGPKTRYANLFLAGAWTDTGYPATMEGAVRSGRIAAKAMVESRKAGA